ncbi:MULTISPECIES: helix-turn-helix domain-containing protein [unclassified Streptomyces]|uniref:winged helix-turn-helix transcriptional regulator n=1 Tax=unclassified Streptomyces TaxID=2593676 RepID=UPI0006FF2396|nr:MULTISPECIES: helix-turn-helix domain-containing protein [unclassified Streptomyces]KQX53482.1 transcriptional regulator [Streptomyces sp. Root1304]KRA90400.1 transcriptional regulator [Streptomyces sp. Root66D1]
MPRQPRRRSYDQHCAAARALDLVGDRWTLLVVRELLAGPRRYTDLHADLPGVSTDMLAGRLKDMEAAELVTRRRLPPPASAYVYELTARGRELLPVLRTLAAWGAPELGEPRPTDAVRAHWYAIPLLGALAELGPGVVQVTLDEGEFHVRVGADGSVAYGDGGYGDGTTELPDARLRTDAATCRALAGGESTLAEAIESGRAALDRPLRAAGVG